ncbi:STN domain-containing protein, partial [Salmonella enterica]|uniref:STN domain-containing protein n=1 Tax=Salmonella enterica TaxID=28901 RepID=UPI0022B6F262|nr:STN domain-containing protein [Salmonella enterica]
RTAFEIRAGSLDKALETLARQSHIQILYAPELVAGRRSRGLSAALTPAEARERLLAGTGRRAVAVNANTFVLQRARAPAPAPRPTPPLRAD